MLTLNLYYSLCIHMLNYKLTCYQEFLLQFPEKKQQKRIYKNTSQFVNLHMKKKPIIKHTDNNLQVILDF